MSDSDIAILTPEGAPLVDPAQIERALAALWKPPTDAAGIEVASRVCVSNLLVVGRAADWGRFADVLGSLSPLYPSRTVILLLGDSPDAAEARATVSALCHVPQSGRPQVCCEQIVVRTGPCEADDLHRTLLPMLEADVPTMCWWTLDPNSCSGLSATVRTVSDRLILDAGLVGLSHLDSGGRCTVRELGWYRTARWREFIAGMFDVTGREALDAIDRVDIEMESASAENHVDAIWLAAFLAGQLGWRLVKTGGKSTFTFESAGRAVAVAIRLGTGGRTGLRSVLIRSTGGHYEISRLPGSVNQYRLTECDVHTCQLPRCVTVAPIPPADALAMAFTGRLVDAAFSRAAPIATRLS